MHTEIAPVLQVLFHAALDVFRSPSNGAGVTAESLLKDCQQSIEDLATMLFEYYGNIIVQPDVTSLRRLHLCGYPSLWLQAS